MRRLLIALFSLVALAGAAVVAQEGHPLKGSWIGTWSGNTLHGNDVLLVLTWDGKTITGTINPGTDNMAIKNASLNPDGLGGAPRGRRQGQGRRRRHLRPRRQDREPGDAQPRASPAPGRASAAAAQFKINRQ